MSDTINLANSIWPNGMIVDSDGYAVFNDLGTDKIPVPTNTSDWPEGDELISPFVYKNKTLVGFVDTKAMTVDNPTAITLDYNRIEADFSSIEEGMLTITAPNATDVKYTWANSSSSDTGNSGDTVTFKYKGCTTVDEVKAVDPDYLTNDIVDGVWSERLDDLEDGSKMFFNTAIKQFNADLSSLITGVQMFLGCGNLRSINTDLGSLQDGSAMFNGCIPIQNFELDLSSLQKGAQMFRNCYGLKNFKSSLGSLTNGFQMFEGCCLSADSIKNIAETINTYNGKLYIGIEQLKPTDEQSQYLTQIHEKGWSVYVNGDTYTPTSPAAITTLDENGEEIIRPIPYYAKPIPATEDVAEYVDSEGNYYNILGGQFIYVSDPETYGMFTCEADAAANMRLTKIERN